jgi:hypothetical protein
VVEAAGDVRAQDPVPERQVPELERRRGASCSCATVLARLGRRRGSGEHLLARVEAALVVAAERVLEEVRRGTCCSTCTGAADGRGPPRSGRTRSGFATAAARSVTPSQSPLSIARSIAEAVWNPPRAENRDRHACLTARAVGRLIPRSRAARRPLPQPGEAAVERPGAEDEVVPEACAGARDQRVVRLHESSTGKLAGRVARVRERQRRRRCGGSSTPASSSHCTFAPSPSDELPLPAREELVMPLLDADLEPR